MATSRYERSIRNELLDMAKQKHRAMLGANYQPVMAGPTAGQFGMMSSTVPAAEDMNALTNRSIARSQFGRSSSAVPQYKGGTRRGLIEGRAQRGVLEAKRNAYQDWLKRREIEEKERMGAWKRSGAGMGVGAGLEGPTGGGGMPTPGGQPQAQGRTFSGAAIGGQPQASPGQPSSPALPFPGTREEMPWSEMPRGTGRITVPGGERAGTFAMNRAGQIRYTPQGRQLPPYEVAPAEPPGGATPQGVDYEPNVPATATAPLAKKPALPKKKKKPLAVAQPGKTLALPALRTPQGARTPRVTMPLQGQPRQFAREAMAPIYRAGGYQGRQLRWLGDKFKGLFGGNAPVRANSNKGVRKTSAGQWLFGR